MNNLQHFTSEVTRSVHVANQL